MKDYIIGCIKVLIIMALVVGLAALIGIAENKADEKAWNDGYCAECGCPWCYQDMYHAKNSGDIYIYTDKENHVIEVHKNYGFGVDK